MSRTARSAEKRKQREKQPAKARRFTAEEHAEAVRRVVKGDKRLDIAEAVGCTTEAIRKWVNDARVAGTLPKARGSNGVAARPAVGTAESSSEVSGKEPSAKAASSAPRDPGAGLGEHEVAAILGYKKKHPSMGPAQIRAQLKRFLGWRISVKAIARTLKRAGYPTVHRGGRPVGDEHPKRWEAPHRNSLWQLDFTTLMVGPERVWLLVVEDDFSRFVVGQRVCASPTSEVAVEVMREAIRLHGKPERVYTDRGAAFTAWRDVTGFEVFLDEELIDHSLRRAHRPQGGGKIEAVIATVQRELWEVVHFESVAEAEQAVAKFFAEYNHQRAHLGIGGLVPADRYYGRWPEVIADIDAQSRRRQGALAAQQDRRLFIEPPAPNERVIALQIVVTGDYAELCVFGRRIPLGRVEV